ncbi:MAG: NAD+ synthase [Candidatus Omnitrophota bacterium]|nr:NAD+ synthase [Candidatus Omnitrophota bacterium]
MIVRIALAQINPTVGDLDGNRRKIVDVIAQAKVQNVDLIVFPELVVCGYPPEDLLLKKHFIKHTMQALQSIVPFTKGLSAVIGYAHQDKDKRLYNAAAVILDAKITGVYRKEELPNYGVFDEKRYFQAGKNNKIFTIKGLKIGVNICEDIWVNQGAYSRQVRQGAKLLINISSSPFDITKLERREKLLKTRVKETGALIVYTNLVGGQDELVFDGTSMVVGPRGQIVARAKGFQEDLLIVDINVNNGRPISVAGRKEEKLSQIERIYQALVLGTRDYIVKNGFKRVVIGLSGGIDSALVAVLACEAVGKDNVVGVSMPSRFSSQGTRNDAKQLAEKLGIEFSEISIETVFESYLNLLKRPFAGAAPNIAEENIQARIRGNILMALSNKFGWLVLTTGNKSEIAVGYCTLYGDMSGGFAVIKDVPKTIVYSLAKLINKEKGGIIPLSIIQREPTAELRENQRDADSLPPYEVLDEILTDYVENHQSLSQMAPKYKKNTIKSVLGMVDRNEYKRRQSPPGIKITPRAFGKDWRLPITNKYKEF